MERVTGVTNVLSRVCTCSVGFDNTLLIKYTTFNLWMINCMAIWHGYISRMESYTEVSECRRKRLGGSGGVTPWEIFYCWGSELNAISYILRAVLKGVWNEKIGLEETFWNNFPSHKDWSSQLSHSLEIFGFVWYVNNSTAYVTLHNDFFFKSGISLRLSKKIKIIKLCMCVSSH